MSPVNHDPVGCYEALARTGGPVVVDLETTGLRRHDRIVSAGLLIDGTAHILFARSSHVSVTNLPLDRFHQALRPLERPELTVVGHNLPFDLGFLRREGVRVGGPARDTLKLLRLLDQDRGGADDMDCKRAARRDLRAPDGAPSALDYKLKHVAAQLLGLRMPHFPGAIALAPYAVHTRYLACDLLGTQRLHDHLWARLSPGEQTYYEQLVAPLIPLLLDLNECGVAADADFIQRECARLQALMDRASEEHRRYGPPLGLDARQLAGWLFGELRLPVLKWARQGRQRGPSLDNAHLQLLVQYAEEPRAIASLKLLQTYRQAASLLVRLRSLARYIDPHTGRIHSTFSDRQATGRISSSVPNLQQLAKLRQFQVRVGDTILVQEEVRCRNALRASPGYEFAVFDIAQADIRVLAHAVETFPHSSAEHRLRLHRERQALMGAALAPYQAALRRCRNPRFRGDDDEPPPEFSPALPPDLAEDFREAAGDFYTKAATRILDRPPKDKQERNRFKSIILGIVNGKGPPSLARDLACTEEEARDYLKAFAAAYPKVTAYKALMYEQIACTGQTSTFRGRQRTVTAHRWLVTEPEAEILVSYRGGDVYWLRIVPLLPWRRVLTSYVVRAWHARTGRLLYDHRRGRLSPRPYRLFEDGDLQYLLPVRNWAWRSIRRVRARGEEAVYEGFDATARSAFNFICQGGTADVSKLMMLASRPVCAEFGARLLIQIHDELVFEVPQERLQPFQARMHAVLERESVPEFQVPIVVEPKRGVTFGALS